MSSPASLKVLLIQLPFPIFRSSKHWGNIPLAAGYLKAMAHKEGLLGKVEIEILGEKDTNLSSDACLVDLIAERRPDVLGFSLYSWNALRTLHIAREAKKKIPGLLVLAGGPEVTLETDYLLDDPAVDIGCLGEGELTFVNILGHLLEGRRDFGAIRGIFHREEGRIVTTAPQAMIEKLDDIPSPYLLGILDPREYGEAWLENMRGCPFKCTYCAHGTRPMGNFSAERIGEELRLVLESGVRKVRFVNGTLISSPNFRPIMDQIIEMNSDRRLQFFGFVYAEHVNERIADLLQQGTFQAFEIGLQSVNADTLKTVNRRAQLGRFLTGIRLLKERKFDVKVDIIIGLPEETLDDFKKTLEFLAEHRIGNIEPLVLFILPGTTLRRDAAKHGIKHQPLPPYLTIEAPYISQEEIEEAISLVKGKPRPETSPRLMVDSCFTEFPRRDGEHGESIFTCRSLDRKINTVVLELDGASQEPALLERLGRQLSRSPIQPLTAWFKTRTLENDMDLMAAFCRPIAEANPYLLWTIVLETDHPLTVSLVERIKQSIPMREVMFDFCRTAPPIEFCGIFPWPGAVDRSAHTAIRAAMPVYWSYEITQGTRWREVLDELFAATDNDGILLDLAPQSTLDFTVEVLQHLEQKRSGQQKNVMLRNLALYYANRIVHGAGTEETVSRPEGLESVLALDRRLTLRSRFRQDQETVMELVAFQMKLRNFIEERNRPLTNPM